MKIPTENFQNLGVQQAQMLQSPGIAPPSGPPQTLKNVADLDFYESAERLMGTLVGALSRSSKSKKELFRKEKYQEQDIMQKMLMRELEKEIPSWETDQLDEKFLQDKLTNKEGKYKLGQDIEYSADKDINKELNNRLKIIHENILGKGMELIMKQHKTRLNYLFTDFADEKIAEMSSSYKITGEDNIEEVHKELEMEFGEYKNLGVMGPQLQDREQRKIDYKWYTVKAQMDYINDPEGFSKTPLTELLRKEPDKEGNRGKYAGDYAAGDVKIITELWGRSADNSENTTLGIIKATVDLVLPSRLKRMWKNKSSKLHQRYENLNPDNKKIVDLLINNRIQSYEEQGKLDTLSVNLTPDNETLYRKHIKIVHGQVRPNEKTLKEEFPTKTSNAITIVGNAIKKEENKILNQQAVNAQKVKNLIEDKQFRKARDLITSGQQISVKDGYGKDRATPGNETLPKIGKDQATTPFLSSLDQEFYSGLLDKWEIADLETSANNWIEKNLSVVTDEEKVAKAEEFAQAVELTRNQDGSPRKDIEINSLTEFQKKVFQASDEAVIAHGKRLAQDAHTIGLIGFESEIYNKAAYIKTSKGVQDLKAAVKNNRSLPGNLKKEIDTKLTLLEGDLSEKEEDTKERKTAETQQKEALILEGNIQTSTNIDKLPSLSEIGSADISEAQKIVLTTQRTLKEQAIQLKQENREASELVSNALKQVSAADTEHDAEKKINEILNAVQHKDEFKRVPQTDKNKLLKNLYDLRSGLRATFDQKTKIKRQIGKDVNYEKISRAIQTSDDPEILNNIEGILQSGQSMEITEGEGPNQRTVWVDTGVKGEEQNDGLTERQKEVLITLLSVKRSGINSEREKPETAIKDKGHRQFYDEQVNDLELSKNAKDTATIKSAITKFRDSINKDPSWLRAFETRVRKVHENHLDNRARQDLDALIHQNPQAVLDAGPTDLSERLSNYKSYQWPSVKEMAERRLDKLTPNIVRPQELNIASANYASYLNNIAFFPEQVEQWSNPLTQKDHEERTLQDRLTPVQMKIFEKIDDYMAYVQDGLSDLMTMQDPYEMELLRKDLLKEAKNKAALSKIIEQINSMINQRMHEFNPENKPGSKLLESARNEEQMVNPDSNDSLGAWRENEYKLGSTTKSFKVVDADTVAIRNNEQQKWRRIRFTGVNAREHGRKDGKGEEATTALKEFIQDFGNNTIRLKMTPEQDYSRKSAYVFINGTQLVQTWLIENNFSTLYTYGGLGGKSTELRQAEINRQAKYGHWQR